MGNGGFLPLGQTKDTLLTVKRKDRSISYKSKLEERVAKRLPKSAEYEPESIKWEQPSKVRSYTPDWKLRDNVFIEAKGKLDLATRQKHIWFKDQHPEITIYFIFEKAGNTIAKNSKTTYGSWAEKNGFEWIDEKDEIPKHWLKGPSENNKSS